MEQAVADTLKNKTLPELHSGYNVPALSRALSLPYLPNSIWKHNERMTELTTLTSKPLHQCFHPLAFSFSTHHFLLLCDWETMTTSESWGWSNIKEAEGLEPTLMWLALPLPVLWHLLWVTPPVPFFFQLNYYFVFSPSKSACTFLKHSTLTFRVSLS